MLRKHSDLLKKIEIDKESSDYRTFIAHTIISGIAIGYMDNLNVCVKTKKIQAMKILALGYDNEDVIVFTIAHAMYTVAVMYFIGASLHF